jgi:MFS superfamily sulfate permease-like transporter
VDYKQYLKSAASRNPALRWIGTYTTSRLALDLVAGLSLAAFVIPESLAYASLAQLPPVTGLYCYLVAGIAYALFGTSRQLAVGPTSALAIVIASSVAAMGGGDPSRAVAIASAIALMAGLVCIAGRFVGLANAAYFISNPVLVGFKTGAALYIASTQLPKWARGRDGEFFRTRRPCRYRSARDPCSVSADRPCGDHALWCSNERFPAVQRRWSSSLRLQRW